VRTLPWPQRQAIALTRVFELSDERAGFNLGLTTTEVDAARETGLATIRELLEHDDLEHIRSAALVRMPAKVIRPIPAGPNGISIIKGTRVYRDVDQPQSLMLLAIKIIERFIDKWRHRHDLEDVFDDDVGDIDKQHSKSPDPTPTMRPMKRPELTPSMARHRMPEPTRGTATHGGRARSTPSTQRLSSPSRSGGGSWSGGWVRG
jgi:hypothetical protein